jgi:pilus assembly protein CpaC
MVWSLIFCAAAPAQESGDTAFEANIQEVQNRTRNVTVALGHTVIITTSQPVKRVQAIDSEVAFVQSVSPQQLLVSGVGYGVTQVLVWSEAGEQNVFQITVVLDLSLLNEAIRKIDPQSDAVASPIGGHIVLSGTVSGATAAERMVKLAELSLPPNTGDRDYTVQNHLDVSGEYQVLLRCTVAEVNRSAIRQLGINGFMAGDHARDMFVVNQLGGINASNIGAAANALVTESIPFLTGGVGIPLSQTTTLSLGFPRVQMQLFMKAMADNSLVRVLAEPNLVVISGETATFRAGGEFPVPVPQATTGGSATTITIEYREFGVRLNFTPVVKAGGRIRLRVAPEVSELDFTNAVQLAGFLVPGLTQRRSETTIELGSGQTIAIAGLLSDEVRGIASRVPGIGDLPVLGALFRSVEYRRRSSELVILVTPEIIAPLNPHEVGPIPGQDLREPSDWDLYALGLLEPSAADRSGSLPGSVDEEGDRIPSAQRQQLGIHGPWGYSTATP